ncbi:hypothetical protein D3C86_1806530 [compost metagenome]
MTSAQGSSNPKSRTISPGRLKVPWQKLSFPAMAFHSLANDSARSMRPCIQFCGAAPASEADISPHHADAKGTSWRKLCRPSVMNSAAPRSRARRPNCKMQRLNAAKVPIGAGVPYCIDNFSV